MVNKRFLVLSFVTIVLALFAAGSAAPRVSAQGGTPAPTSSIVLTPVATAAPVNGEKQVLNVYNFTTYIAEDTISNFEKLYNVKVNYDNYASNDELVAKLQAGNPGYDVIVAGNYYVGALVRAGLLEEIDLNNIPNFTKYAAKSFVNPTYDPGNKHCIAYQWGTMGIGYNEKKVGHEITTWAEIFGDEYKGRVAFIDAVREQMGMWLIMLGLDPNTTNKDDLLKVKDYIIAHKGVISSFHEDDGQTKLARGEVDVVVEWNGDIIQVMADNPDLRYVIPKEGSIIWADNMCVPKGAKNPELAQKFLNYIYDPQVGASISNTIHYGTPNQGALDGNFIDKADMDNPSIYPPPEVSAKLKFLGDVGDAQALYDEIFADIKAGVSS